MLEAALGGRSAVVEAYEQEQSLVTGGAGGLGLKTYTYTDEYELPDPSGGADAPWTPFEVDPIPAGKIWCPVMSAEMLTPTITADNEAQPGQAGALVAAVVECKVTMANAPANIDPFEAPSGGPMLITNTNLDANGNPVAAPDQWWYHISGFGLQWYWAPVDLNISFATMVHDTQLSAYMPGCKVRNLDLTVVTFE